MYVNNFFLATQTIVCKSCCNRSHSHTHLPTVLILNGFEIHGVAAKADSKIFHFQQMNKDSLSSVQINTHPYCKCLLIVYLLDSL